MAVAVPKRRTAPAPPPARTTPPKRRRATAPATAPKRRKAAPATAPKRRKVASSRAVAVPARKPVRHAPARAPQRARPKTRRNPGARVIPLAGRTAVAVSQLPDSGLMVRMTRGRAWIVVLGVLLAGIVALNVITLSFAASSGKIDEQIGVLDKENSILRGRDAIYNGIGRVRDAGSAIGLSQPSGDTIKFVDIGPDDVATAAARLAAAGQ